MALAQVHAGPRTEQQLLLHRVTMQQPHGHCEELADPPAVSASNGAGPAGEGASSSLGLRPPLLFRLLHLKRITFLPGGQGGCSGGDALLHLLSACFTVPCDANSGPTLSELRYDDNGVVSASSRAAQSLRLPLAVVQQVVNMHSRQVYCKGLLYSRWSTCTLGKCTARAWSAAVPIWSTVLHLSESLVFLCASTAGIEDVLSYYVKVEYWDALPKKSMCCRMKKTPNAAR